MGLQWTLKIENYIFFFNYFFNIYSYCCSWLESMRREGGAPLCRLESYINYWFIGTSSYFGILFHNSLYSCKWFWLISAGEHLYEYCQIQ